MRYAGVWLAAVLLAGTRLSAQDAFLERWKSPDNNRQG
jgi:hypothetical protein